MEQNNNVGFSFSYSAIEQAEIRRIREKYETRDSGIMEQVRRLDRSVTSKAQIASLTTGIVGTLLLGFGMSLAISELAELLRMSHALGLLIGCITGILGGVMASLAYPMYFFVVQKERKRIAPLMLRLTDELLK